MQRYDSYKDSGIQWLGEIPSHWNCDKAKHHFQSRKQIVGSNSSHYDRLALTLKGVIKRSEGDNIGLNPEKLDTYQIVEKNDLIFKLIDLENISTSRVGLSQYQGIVSPAYIRVAAISKANPRFAEYFYLNMWMRHIFNDFGTPGVRSNLSSTDLLNLPFLYPSIEEQQAIVSYLDTATAKIDEAIAQQQKMIDLLNERKQIIINNAVTKGLNPNAKMKPSGIDWIGNIPEHWETRAIKFLFNQRNEYNTPIKTSERLSLSIDKGVTLYSEKTTNLDRFKEDVSQYKVAYPNDIILNSMNMIVGAVGLSKYMGCVSPAYYVIYASTKIDVLYYSYLLNIRSIRATYRVLGRGIYSIDRGDGRVNTCRLKVPYGDFSRIEVPLPPQEEQKQISLYLKSQQKRIDIKIEMCNKQIALLQERKQIIINNVVTGKVKVCNN